MDGQRRKREFWSARERLRDGAKRDGELNGFQAANVTNAKAGASDAACNIPDTVL